MTFDFTNWITEVIEALCSLLLTPPISWFIGLIICIFVVKIIVEICKIGG